MVEIQIGVETEITSPEHRPGRWSEEVVPCPDDMSQLSAVPTRSNGIQRIIFGYGLTTVVAEMLPELAGNRLRCSTRGFLPGFTSVAFPVFEYERKSVVV